MSSTSNEAATPKKESFELDEDILMSPESNNSDKSTSSPAPSSPDSPDISIGSDSLSNGESPTSSEGTPAAQPATEKKPVKKRRSWGQELPIPTTNLPPRKRAKTEAEKEQRRIERVLRNRAAAQSSRERKRKEVEALEENRNELAQDNVKLKQRNEQLEALCQQLSERIEFVIGQNQSMMSQLKDLACGTCKKMAEDAKTYDFNPILLSPPLSIKTDPSSPLLFPSDPVEPPKLDGTLDPSQLSTPSDSKDGDHFSATQLTAAKLCDPQCQLKTGPSSENQQGVRGVSSTTMRWMVLTTTVFMTLFLMISSPSMILRNLGQALPLLLLISSWISNKLIQPFRRKPLTTDLSCALLLDATGLSSWFECTFKESDQMFVSRKESRSLGRNSTLADDEFVWRRYRLEEVVGGFGKPIGIIKWRKRRLMSFQLSNLLSFQGIG